MNIDKDLYYLLLVFKNNLLDEKSFNSLRKKESLYSIVDLIENFILCNFSNTIISNFKNELDIYLKSLKENNINIISYKHELFPNNLFDIDLDFRPFLYYKGNLNLLKNKTFNIGIVGTRQPSLKGKKLCKKIAQEIFSKNFNIVSGFANGIDTIAQSQNLESNIIVIPNGFNDCYPSKNFKLLKKINNNLDMNLILTPFHFGEKISIDNFRKRNKIIASVVDKLIVVESNLRSGSLMTARYANILKKQIYTISNISSIGNDFLIKKMNAKDYFINAIF